MSDSERRKVPVFDYQGAPGAAVSDDGSVCELAIGTAQNVPLHIRMNYDQIVYLMAVLSEMSGESQRRSTGDSTVIPFYNASEVQVHSDPRTGEILLLFRMSQNGPQLNFALPRLLAQTVFEGVGAALGLAQVPSDARKN